jgi:hypothetical protein
MYSCTFPVTIGAATLSLVYAAVNVRGANTFTMSGATRQLSFANDGR